VLRSLAAELYISLRLNSFMVRVDKQWYLSDFYNQYENCLNGKTIHELIDMFNLEHGINVASSARFKFLRELNRAFRESGYDCASIESGEKGLTFKYPIKLDGRTIVQIIE
jgi:hypothetical protein